ncbi:hypothetical protein [Bauldia litoralis]|uniref:hypothetical protein n=1 Tax=Bauldia litoralis TaxID=665467 RepID=UPI003264114C
MHFLVEASDKPASIYPYRANPGALWDWFTLDDIDIYNDIVLTMGEDHTPVPDTLIRAGLDQRHLFAIDEERDIQWAYAPDYLRGVLNR